MRQHLMSRLFACEFSTATQTTERERVLLEYKIIVTAPLYLTHFKSDYLSCSSLKCAIKRFILPNATFKSSMEYA